MESGDAPQLQQQDGVTLAFAGLEGALQPMQDGGWEQTMIGLCHLPGPSKREEDKAKGQVPSHRICPVSWTEMECRTPVVSA